jgi:hypothetical protein
MKFDGRVAFRLAGVATLLVSALLVTPQPGFAAKQPKTYPEEGKIIGVGINQVGRSRTYKVVTGTRTYELDCGKHPALFSSTPGECGGDKKLEIGDVIHFRIEKGRAYIPVPPTVEANGEQQLRILREEAKAAAVTQTPPPEKTDAKPEAEKQ